MDAKPELKTIEQIRQRLFTLSITLQKLHDQFKHGEQPLPAWGRLSITQKALAGQLKTLQELLVDPENSAFLKSAHAYPNSKFPWTEENTLGLLLRKRLDPDVVTWVNKARNAGVQLDGESRENDLNTQPGALDKKQWEELWDWAGPSANELIRDVFAPEEDQDEDEDMEDSQGANINVKDLPMMPINDLLKFGATGAVFPTRPAGR